MALRSCSALGMLLPFIIIIMQICSLAFDTQWNITNAFLNAYWVYTVESVYKV